MKEVLTIIIYRTLDRLKQKSPAMWAVAQALLWSSFITVSTNWINFKGEEYVLVILGGLISGVGTRTTKKLQTVTPTKIIDPEKFKAGVDKAKQDIEKLKEDLTIKPVKHDSPITIIQKPLNKGQWISEKTEKKFIVLHHSVSSSVDSIVNHWNFNKERVGTAFSIDRDGTIYQHFPEDEWASHLYIGFKGNNVSKGLKRHGVQRDMESIGIELVSAGGLTLKDKWTSSFNSSPANIQVLDKPYRGYKAFEKYTDRQIESLEKLLVYLLVKYNLKSKLKKDYSNICELSDKALKGEEVIISHSSVRSDKSDVFPQKELIDMLNTLHLLKENVSKTET